MAQVKVHGADGKESGSAAVPASYLAERPSTHSVYEAVKMYQANQRLGSVHRKNRSAVSGGSRKPWKQKGTGRARQGTTRAPQWRGGGRAFPPMERDYSYQIPRKMRQLAARTVLTEKAKDGSLAMLEAAPQTSGRTREIAGFLENLGCTGRRVLILVAEPASAELMRASRNIPGLVINQFAQTNALELIHAHHVFVEQGALKEGAE